MSRNDKSIDGLVRRTGDAPRAPRNLSDVKTTTSREYGRTARKPELKDDIDEVLRNLPDPSEESPKKLRSKRKKAKKQGKPKKKIIKRVLLVLLILFLAGLGYFIYRFIKFGDSVFEGSIISLIQKEKLKEDANGRTNILIFGTEEAGHPGADLTDSIMVLSINQTTKDAYMISLPRDLYVGTCTSTGKLNETYWCTYQDDEAKEKAGAEALQAEASKILGLDIQYWVHVNWEVLRKSVEAVGGVDVTIESSDPRGILDRNFDWVCNYQCYFVNYKNGEVAHMDGEHALAFARARNAAGGYGLPRGNFDREHNQQLVLAALQKKALSAGVLANPKRVLDLMESLGQNLHTSFHTSEVQTLIELAKDVKNDDIISVPLLDGEKDIHYMKTANIDGISVVVPTAGQGNYEAIHSYIKKVLSNDPVAREYASIDVLNGSDTEGLGAAEAKKLEQANYNVVNVSNAPSTISGKIEIYQLNSKMTGTAKALKKRFSVKTIQTKLPAGIASDSDFVIIFGKSTSK
ncbi:MAG: LCP family protein [Candidatus Nomurabacteria bacterium]|jgi:LCP family protein required for cell wall assembly|nr:LCP family protein [Candidatus Nomurabacteria bacterium]